MNWERFVWLFGLSLLIVSVPLLILEKAAEADGSSIVELFGEGMLGWLVFSRIALFFGALCLLGFGARKLYLYVR